MYTLFHRMSPRYAHSLTPSALTLVSALTGAFVLCNSLPLMLGEHASVPGLVVLVSVILSVVLLARLSLYAVRLPGPGCKFTETCPDPEAQVPISLPHFLPAYASWAAAYAPFRITRRFLACLPAIVIAATSGVLLTCYTGELGRLLSPADAVRTGGILLALLFLSSERVKSEFRKNPSMGYTCELMSESYYNEASRTGNTGNWDLPPVLTEAHSPREVLVTGFAGTFLAAFAGERTPRSLQREARILSAQRGETVYPVLCYWSEKYRPGLPQRVRGENAFTAPDESHVDALGVYHRAGGCTTFFEDVPALVRAHQAQQVRG